MLNDLRFALRMLRKSPGFAGVAILALAVGIGANTAIFSVVNAVLLRSLPYREPDRLVMLFEALPKFGAPVIPFSAPDLEEFEHQNQTFEAIAPYQNKRYELSGVDQPERLMGARVSPALFPVLGVQPILGRAFTAEDDRQDRKVLVLSYGLWQRRFGSDPTVVGRNIAIDRQPYQAIGVMPRGFEFPHRGSRFNDEPADLWVPIAFTPDERQTWGMMYNSNVVARLKPGISLERARVTVEAMAKRVLEKYPPVLRNNPLADLTARVEPLHDEIVGSARRALLVLLGAVGLVMLIACADIANLLLTRVAARNREMGIRLAMGASRRRLIGQALVESLLLAFAGGTLGLLLAWWGVDLLVALKPGAIPLVDRIGIDTRVLLFTLLVSIATALIFGLAPALEASASDVSGVLKEGGRGAGTGRKRHRMLGVLVAAQFAMALVLLVGAGLLVRSFVRLITDDPGFRPERLLSMSVSLPAKSYAKADQVRLFYQQFLERLEALPGVRAAGATSGLPLMVQDRRMFTGEGQSSTSGGAPPNVAAVWVLGNYLEALGVPLKQGRFFTARDRNRSEPVVIISETMARRFWPGQNPIGQRIKWGIPESYSPWTTIIGVVADVKQGPLNTEAVPQTYEPYLQLGDGSVEENVGGIYRSLNLVVRAQGDPALLVSAIRRDVRGLDPSLPLANVRTMEEHMLNSVSTQRFNMYLLAAFAGVALFLAAIGIYGVLAYSVAQRTHEIGVRLALGAHGTDVVWMVVLHGMRLAGAGILTGLGASLAVTRVMASLLYQTSAYDPWTFTVVASLLAAVAFVACYVPARRATRVDPMVALRYE
jgi:predicted permease